MTSENNAKKPDNKAKCEYGSCLKLGEYRRQNTNYHDDAQNFATYCEEHQEEVDKHWYEMWKEYWSDKL